METLLVCYNQLLQLYDKSRICKSMDHYFGIFMSEEIQSTLLECLGSLLLFLFKLMRKVYRRHMM
jgi:hypothetical protein